MRVWRWLGCVNLMTVVLACGCQSARTEQPVVANLAGNDADAQIEFWHTLAGQAVTSNDDAFHGLLLFLEGHDSATDYAGRVRALKDRSLLPAKFDRPANEAIDRGTLAVAISKILKIRGGVVMTLTGASPRYAVKELVFLNVYPSSSPNQTFSGSEFLGIIGKVEDHQRVARAGTARPLQSLDATPIEVQLVPATLPTVQ